MATSVLIVDDNPDITTLLKMRMEKKGFTAETVYSGEAAMIAAQKNPFDLVLLDIMLPRVDGFEVCRRLKAGNSKIKVIAMTALDIPGIGDKCFEAGADAVMLKPFDMDDLEAHLNKMGLF